ncbi:MAG TPA: MtsA protein [Vulgatibacter sp.]|nr:MtsA protein [Vulgatibacter sp.]
MKRWILAAAVVALGAAIVWMAAPLSEARIEATPARLRAVGPRMISNETDYPVMVYGEGLREGMRLRLGDRVLETRFVDERHLGAVIPAGWEIPSAQAIARLEATLEGAEGQAELTIVNDAAFRTPLDLAAGSRAVYVASRTTDEILVVEGGEVRSIPTCDGPRSLALHGDAAGEEWLAVVCEHAGELRLMSTADPQRQRSIPVGPALREVAIHGAIAWVTEQLTDTAVAVDLASGAIVERVRSPVHPGPLATLGELLLVGNQSSEDLTLAWPGVAGGVRLARAERPAPKRVAPDPSTPIVGGHTERFTPWVMGGKRVRAIAASDRLGVFFVTSLGPNIGPNPDRMEITMNGGVGVVDTDGAFLRHVPLRRGLPQGLALDDARGLLYVADLSTGRIEILDARKLAASDEEARGAFVASLDIPPSADTPRIRPPEDFGVEGRSGESLHSGPHALALTRGGEELVVLARFAGAVQRVDVSDPKAPRLGERVELGRFVEQPARRLGEIVYHTDLGNSRMTCDACHPGGSTGGILFTKGTPMRIYRSPTMRAVRDSAPYFTPSMLPTLRNMARDVLGRNRFYNPRPTKTEIAALAHFTETIVPLPNPWVGPGGELPRRVELPDGGVGDAVAGLRVFEASGCESCHPPPQFTTDQDEATRGRLHHAGTPLALPLRPSMQDMELDPGWPPVSLVGVWNTFPLLSSGAAGLEVEGDAVVPQPGMALRRVLQSPLADGVAHEAAARLDPKQRDDLIAYLLTL